MINRMLLEIMARVQNLLSHDDERGQGLVEYALIIALISIVAALALAAMTGGFGNIASAISGKLNSAASSLS